MSVGESSALASSSSSARPADGDSGGSPAARRSGPVVTKLHLLPMLETEVQIQDQCTNTMERLNAIAPALRELREAGTVVKAGDLVRHETLEFAIVKCDPAEGVLGVDTEYFLDGHPVTCFEKIQFSAWGPTEMSSDDLFAKCVVKYIKGDGHGAYGNPATKQVRLFYCGMVIEIDGIILQVEATEPQGLGVVSKESEIYANWDHTPDFDKVHIVPFQDTLPRAYDFDIFTDYLRPYLKKNHHKKFVYNELFTFHGVQFKMVACEPSSACARIGKSTTIYCEGVLPPSMRNLLSPEQLSQVAQLPPGLQMLLLNTERTTRELEDVLTQRRGLFEETIGEVEKVIWPPNNNTNQNTCMVCLYDFELQQECRRLPCQHIFHQSCIDEWLRRCTDCPICKANVDRAIRNY